MKKSSQDKLIVSHIIELRHLLGAFDNYFMNGEASRPELDELLEKHGFNLKEPIGILDIISGYCKRYNIEARWDEKGRLQATKRAASSANVVTDHFLPKIPKIKPKGQRMNSLADLMAYGRRVSLEKEKLIISKNADYSEEVDAHGNFRTVSELCASLNVDVQTPAGVVEFMILWKIHRLVKLKNEGKEPENESLFDNNVDIQNYLDLLVTIEDR